MSAPPGTIDTDVTETTKKHGNYSILVERRLNRSTPTQDRETAISPVV